MWNECPLPAQAVVNRQREACATTGVRVSPQDPARIFGAPIGAFGTSRWQISILDRRMIKAFATKDRCGACRVGDIVTEPLKAEA